MAEHFEKQISSKPIFDGQVVKLRVDTVELENGAIVTRELIEHPGGAAMLAVDDQDRILFVRQFRYGAGKVLLELPAGKLELGEDPQVCAVRELEEECGCVAGRVLPLTQLYPTCAYDNEMIYVYYADHLHETKQKLDGDEFLTVERIPVDKAVELALSGEITDAKSQLGVLKYALLRQMGRLNDLEKF